MKYFTRRFVFYVNSANILTVNSIRVSDCVNSISADARHSFSLKRISLTFVFMFYKPTSFLFLSLDCEYVIEFIRFIIAPGSRSISIRFNLFTVLSTVARLSRSSSDLMCPIRLRPEQEKTKTKYLPICRFVVSRNTGGNRSY